jgi:hypothetical protein
MAPISDQDRGLFLPPQDRLARHFITQLSSIDTGQMALNMAKFRHPIHLKGRRNYE